MQDESLTSLATRYFEAGHTLVVNPAKDRARFFADGGMKLSIDLDDAEVIRRTVGPEYAAQIIVVTRSGRVTLDEWDGEAFEPARSEKDSLKSRLGIPEDVEVMTWEQIAERWPGLDEHYQDLTHILSTYAANGKINKTGRGPGYPALYYIDDAFFAWIRSIGVDPESGELEEDEGESGVEKLTTSEVRERWPALAEHYQELPQALWNAWNKGVIHRSKDGRYSLWHIDEAWFAWLSSLDLDSEIPPPSDPGEGHSDDAQSPEPDPAEASPGAHALVHANASDDVLELNGRTGRLTIEQRLALVRAAHHDYVDALHGGDPAEIDAAREALREAWEKAHAQMGRLVRILQDTWQQVLRPAGGAPSRVNGLLSRITGDDVHRETATHQTTEA